MMSHASRRGPFLVAFAVLAALLTLGCEHVDHYVWYKSLDPNLKDGHAFHIAPGDKLKVDVWKQGNLSGEVRVRSDGFISLPLVGDVRVAGLTPSAAAGAVRTRVASVVLEPKVVVSVVEPEPLRIGVLGQVTTPGMYELARGSGVLQALSRAGGLNSFADSSRIFVIPNGEKTRPIRFTFSELVSGSTDGGRYVLQPGDTVLVE